MSLTADKQESTGFKPPCTAYYAVLQETAGFNDRLSMQVFFHKVNMKLHIGGNHVTEFEKLAFQIVYVIQGIPTDNI